MSRRAVVVREVGPGGVAAEAGILPGDRVRRVNGQPLADSLDFELLASEPVVRLAIERDGERREAMLEREWGQGLGLTVGHAPRVCRLRCRFCFVDQQPRGMRRSLCVKDDDIALSFRDGNFVTLSNIDDEDQARVEELRLSPLYVSVHATDPVVRDSLLRPRGRAGRDVLPRLRELVAAGVEVHAQIVLVPGCNDGAQLERTLGDLSALVPGVRSIAVVPVGLTRYTKDERLRTWRADEAPGVLAQLAPWRERLAAAYGVPVVVPSDEWYLLAGEEPPPAETYDGFPQIENGVGLVRQLLDELETGGGDPLAAAPGRRIVLATGTLARPVLERVAARLASESGASIRVQAVESRFWGPRVTVAGLLTGEDLLAGLAGLDADVVVLPDVLRNEDGLLLDGLSADELTAALPQRVVFAAPGLAGLRDALGPRGNNSCIRPPIHPA